jgi:sugar phosphate isomerase/epimerase
VLPRGCKYNIADLELILSPDVDPESFGNEAPRDGDEAAWETLYRYADEMKALAAKHGVEMRSLQCLGQVDTWPEGSDREKWGFAKAIHWITLCHHLGLEFCQVGVNDQYEATAPFGKTVADLGYIADEAAKHNVKIAYESWNFAPRMSQWEGTWNVVKAAVGYAAG